MPTKQKDLLHFINDRLQRDGVPPSFDEMKEALDLRSKSEFTVDHRARRTRVHRRCHRARAIEIVKLPEAMGEPPRSFTPRVIDGDRPDSTPASAMTWRPQQRPADDGKIAAGVPIEATRSDRKASRYRQGARQGEHYALEVGDP